MTEDVLLDPESTETQPPLTQLERVTNTFIAPSKTFLDIRRNQSWWLPLLIVVVFGYLFTLGALNHIGIDRIVDGMIKASPQAAEKFQNLSPEQQAAQIKGMKMFVPISFYAGPIFILIFCAISALLLWVGFNFILGGKSTYGKMFAVAVFASLPGIFKSLIAALLIFFGDNEGFNLSDPVGTNPGFYLGSDSATWLKSLLGSFDIFTLWSLALLALGGAIVAYVKPKSGFILVFVTFLLIVLIKVGFAAATS